MEIPYQRLKIPPAVQPNLAEGAPQPARMALARGLLPTTTDVQLGICYLLATQPDPVVAAAARKTLVEVPKRQLLPALTPELHPKILEYLVEFRPPDPEVDERVVRMRTANDRTVRLIAARADAELCDQLGGNQERLLLTPEVYLDLHANPACSPAVLQRAEGFLRMHQSLPAGAPAAPATATQAPRQVPAPTPMDLEAEIEAALQGKQSPSLLHAQQGDLAMFDDAVLKGSVGSFRFDFSDEDANFSWNLLQEKDGSEGIDPDETMNIERMIADMSVGKRIKLAYLGNKQVRAVLIRDQNSIVSCAVVKSGRLSDGEVSAYAANRNMGDDVIREIALNREFVRRYPVKVALVNNPKTPPSVAMGFVPTLQKKDLQNLSRNRNVPSMIFQAATRLYKTKYRD